MYCSRRGREVPRPTDTCTRCGRCNWEQDAAGKAKNGIGRMVIFAGVILFAVMLFLIR